MARCAGAAASGGTASRSRPEPHATPAPSLSVPFFRMAGTFPANEFATELFVGRVSAEGVRFCFFMVKVNYFHREWDILCYQKYRFRIRLGH